MIQKHIETFFDKFNIFSKKNILLLSLILFSLLLVFFQNINKIKISIPLAMAQEWRSVDPFYSTFQSTIEGTSATQFLAAATTSPSPCFCPCGGCTGSCGACYDRYRIVGGYVQHQVQNCVSCCPKYCSRGSWHYHEWCGDNTTNGFEACDLDSTPAPLCIIGGYAGKTLCNRCDWQYNIIDAITCPAPSVYSYNSSQCQWEGCTPIDWCGDDLINGTPEECDGLAGDPSACNVPLKIDANDGLSDTVRYAGLYLCDKCDWESYNDRDGDPSDNEICAPRTTCDTTFSCSSGAALPWYADALESSIDTGTCIWDSGAECTPTDWCGDGAINGPEQFCDIHVATGTVDFGGETCASKVCSDIDPLDIEGKSLYSQNPGCNAEMATVGAGSLTCVNTCRHIYTVPGCEFPLNANGIDLSDDVAQSYIYVTDSSLWSLQVFEMYTPPTSLVNTQKLKVIYYFDSEPLSVDVVGDYAYVGTTTGLSILNIDQLNKADEYPDGFGPPPAIDPYEPKGVPYPFFEEQPPTIVTIATLGEVNDVHIVGNYAYLAIGTTDAVGPAAMQIIDITNPALPVLSGSYSYPNTKGGVRSVDVKGNHVYVSYNNGSAGTASFDYFLSANKTIPPFWLKSINIGSSTSSIDIATDSLGNDFAYIDGLSTFHSVDINTPNVNTSVVATDNINLGVPANEVFAMDINDAGTFVYVSVQDIGLRAVNITDPEIFTYGDTFSAPTTTSTIVDIVVDSAGGYAYTAGLDLGLVIFKLDDSCGDDIADDFEVCDGTDLKGMSCSNISPYVEGDLGCGPFCNEFDISDCVACVTGDFYCPDGCTNPPDRDCPACTGVTCNNPGPCQLGGTTGSCESVGGFPVCVYVDDPDACNTPGPCQVGIGRCEVDPANPNAKLCFYDDQATFCDLDGDICTGDVCVSPDGGLSSTCRAGENICEGLVPCGRMVNNPATAWDDTDSCDLCYGILLLNQGMNFLTAIAGIVSTLALIITGLLFITSAGNVERKNSAKTMFKTVLIGFIILFLSWLIVDFVLSVLGYIDPLGGKWNVTCE